MDVQVLTKRENPLLKRTEIAFKVIHKAEPTPTRDTIRGELAKQLQAAKDHVIVDSARSSFGRFETIGYAKVYKSKDDALAIERPHILVRNKLKEPEAKEKKEAVAKPEKPAKPEAPKKEEKPEAKVEAKAEHKPEAKPEPKAEVKAERKEKAAPKEEKKHATAEKKEEKHEEKKAEGKPEAKKPAPKKKEG
jgi:small subunit ribosomal protein S24e